MAMSRAKLGGNSSIQTLWQVGLLLLCPEELYSATPLLYFDVNRISAITKCPLYCNWHSQITTKVFIKYGHLLRLNSFYLKQMFLRNKYRHSSIYAAKVGTHKKMKKHKQCKLMLLSSSTKGEENRIES